MGLGWGGAALPTEGSPTPPAPWSLALACHLALGGLLRPPPHPNLGWTQAAWGRPGGDSWTCWPGSSLVRGPQGHVTMP